MSKDDDEHNVEMMSRRMRGHLRGSTCVITAPYIIHLHQQIDKSPAFVVMSLRHQFINCFLKLSQQFSHYSFHATSTSNNLLAACYVRFIVNLSPDFKNVLMNRLMRYN